MTATEMEDVLKNLDLRTSRIEQFLPTVATKDDLKVYATKDDLKVFATKDDLKVFATKADLADVKTDLARFATKADLEEVKTHLAVRIEAVEEKLGTIADHLADSSQRLPPRT